jgi:hypothetical protein
MIFIPRKDGISHKEMEATSKEQAVVGCDVLLQSLVAQAKMS